MCFATKCEGFLVISHTKSRWDTCFNGTLAFPDYKRSEVGGEPAISLYNIIASLKAPCLKLTFHRTSGNSGIYFDKNKINNSIS